MKEYYKILQVPFWASDEEVKKAYRILVQEHHPDRNEANVGAEEKIKEINEAYTVLGNSEKRREYDFNCIIHNHYTSVQTSPQDKSSEKDTSVFSSHSFVTSVQEEPTIAPPDLNLHQQWKKVLLITLPVLAVISVIYFLLPGKKQVVEKTPEIVVPAKEVVVAEDMQKKFSPVNHATIITKWQTDKLLYKLDLWMPAENKTPAQQSQYFFGDNVHVDFFDKDGFKVFNIPLQSSLTQAAWKRQDTIYTLTISDQVVMSHVLYTSLADWKMNQTPAATSIIQTSSPSQKSNTNPVPARQLNTSAKPVLKTTVLQKKQAKPAEVSKKLTEDILNDETIRNGFKKNKQ